MSKTAASPTTTSANPPRMRKTLTAKEQRFVEQYCIHLNATQAAIRAGYSQRTARQIGYRLLTKVHIGAAVAEWKQRESERVRVTRDVIVAEHMKVLLVAVDPAKVRPADKLQAGMNIAKLLGYVTEKVEHSGKVDLDAARREGMQAVFNCSDTASAEALVAKLKAHFQAMKDLMSGKGDG